MLLVTPITFKKTVAIYPSHQLHLEVVPERNDETQVIFWSHKAFEAILQA